MKSKFFLIDVKTNGRQRGPNLSKYEWGNLETIKDTKFEGKKEEKKWNWRAEWDAFLMLEVGGIETSRVRVDEGQMRW